MEKFKLGAVDKKSAFGSWADTHAELYRNGFNDAVARKEFCEYSSMPYIQGYARAVNFFGDINARFAFRSILARMGLILE